MRLTDLILYALLGFVIFGATDPAGAANLLGHWNDQLRALLHWWM